jgi:hypothetical protein
MKKYSVKLNFDGKVLNYFFAEIEAVSFEQAKRKAEQDFPECTAKWQHGVSFTKM